MPFFLPPFQLNSGLIYSLLLKEAWYKLLPELQLWKSYPRLERQKLHAQKSNTLAGDQFRKEEFFILKMHDIWCEKDLTRRK